MVISFASRSASRMMSSYALRRISLRSRGLRAAQPSNAPCAASTAALASSTLALATEVILFSVAGSITSKRAPSDDLRHLPPIHRSVGTFARRFSYMRHLLQRLESYSLAHILVGEPVATSPEYALRRQRPPNRVGDPVHRGQDHVLQDVGSGQ